MKKLIFLLIMALAVTGMVSAAGAAYLPKDYSPEEIMSEFGEDGFAVAPDTVPAMVPLDIELPAGLAAIPDYITDYAVQMKHDHLCKPVDSEMGRITTRKNRGYWLRL